MSANIDHGGPAFARPGFFHSDGTSEYDCSPEDGMSLRDWFAGQALIGLMSYPGDETSGNWHNNSSSQGVALRCYDLADAMIAARKAGAE